MSGAQDPGGRAPRLPSAGDCVPGLPASTVPRLLAAEADPAVQCHGLSPRDVAMRKVDRAIFGLLVRHAAMKAVGL